MLRDALALAEDLVERPLAHYVPEGGLGEQPRRVVGVLHVRDRNGGVGDAVVDHRVHRDRHAVLCQNLRKRGGRESTVAGFRFRESSGFVSCVCVVRVNDAEAARVAASGLGHCTLRY